VLTFVTLENLRDENGVDPENDTDDRRAHDNDNDNDNAIVEGPAVQAYVELARTIRKLTYLNRRTPFRDNSSQNTNVK
jgi:hypothetical protein